MGLLVLGPTAAVREASGSGLGGQRQGCEGPAVAVRGASGSGAWSQRAAQDLTLQLIPAFRGLWDRADLDLHRARRAPARGIRQWVARVVEGPDDAGSIGQGERMLARNVRHERSCTGTVTALGTDARGRTRCADALGLTSECGRSGGDTLRNAR